MEQTGVGEQHMNKCGHEGCDCVVQPSQRIAATIVRVPAGRRRARNCPVSHEPGIVNVDTRHVRAGTDGGIRWRKEQKKAGPMSRLSILKGSASEGATVRRDYASARAVIAGRLTGIDGRSHSA